MSDDHTLFLLHGLGCSARLWRFIEPRLDIDCVALDLPGHGSAAGSDQLTVEQMVDVVTAEVLGRAPARWSIAGHSMGGKIAALVAARAERGIPGLSPPLTLTLVAASPLSPEPMADHARDEMLAWVADGAVSDVDAAAFVDANTAATLPADVRTAAVADVRAVDPTAWRAWFERGSREDWRGSAPVHTPTLVVAGEADDDLGVDAQQRLVLPLVNAIEVAPVPDAAHLIPLEAPERLAELISAHLAATSSRLAALPAPTRQLLMSDRVSARTRSLLVDRVAEPTGGVLSTAQRAALAALVSRVLPQRRTDVDLVARLDARLASSTGDGWRFAALPPDAEAWPQGIDTLLARAGDYAALPSTEQDAWIERMINGDVGADAAGHLSAAQMTLWFEDVRAETVRAWLSHPAAQAAIGYDGFANGGDGTRLQGYLQIGTGEREAWQRDLPVDEQAAS